MKYCPECGKELIIDTKFCSECGVDLTQVLQSTPEQEAEETTFIEEEAAPTPLPESKPIPKDERKYCGLCLIFLTIYVSITAFALITMFWSSDLGLLLYIIVSFTFLILFLSLAYLYIKKIEDITYIGTVIIISSFVAGIAWSLVLGLTNGGLIGGGFIWVWIVTLFAGFIILTHSYFKSMRREVREEMKKEILELGSPPNK